ncbi:MAG: Daunorubicin/doxorubicin resistance ATP-binding protein DrrA [Candidatus Eisenbacteria bacterium]|jgi:ABC-2 type transport system ATP-binding protein
MLEVVGLVRDYGARRALDDVSLTVAAGSITGLLGANGAGKSTLLRTAAGLQPPDHGSVRVAGHDVWAAPIAAKAGLGYAAEDPVFHDELSAREYLAFVASVRALPPDEADARVAELSSSLDLSNRLDEPVAGFSHGMRKKLSFVAAILHRPRVLLCDEALEGFDAPSALAAKQELRALAAGGTAVLFSSHVTETVERLCDRVVMLRNGRIAATLERAEWGAPDDRVSPLERIFLDLTRTPDPVA